MVKNRGISARSRVRVRMSHLVSVCVLDSLGLLDQMVLVTVLFWTVVYLWAGSLDQPVCLHLGAYINSVIAHKRPCPFLHFSLCLIQPSAILVLVSADIVRKGVKASLMSCTRHFVVSYDRSDTEMGDTSCNFILLCFIFQILMHFYYLEIEWSNTIWDRVG